jgi:hypothetical protein
MQVVALPALEQRLNPVRDAQSMPLASDCHSPAVQVHQVAIATEQQRESTSLMRPAAGNDTLRQQGCTVISGP